MTIIPFKCSNFYFILFSYFSCVDIDDCAKKPCLNGARCVDKLNSYQCICITGFKGVNCETSKFLGSSLILKKIRGEQFCLIYLCFWLACEYELQYVHDYKYTLLKLKDIDDCATNPCRYGARCVDKVNSYQCVCKSGYSGVNCDIGKFLSWCMYRLDLTLDNSSYHVKTEFNNCFISYLKEWLYFIFYFFLFHLLLLRELMYSPLVWRHNVGYDLLSHVMTWWRA